MDRRRQLEGIYDKHANAVQAFLLTLLRDHDSADEVLQEVFCKIAARDSILDDVANERSYLIKLAHNLAIDSIRRQTAYQRKKKAFAESAASPFAPSSNPDEQAFRVSLSNAMRDLPIERRTVVYLKLWEDMTFDAIAKLLDLPPNTAASRYRYGLNKLQTQLRPVYEELK